MGSIYEKWTEDVVSFSHDLANFLQKENDALDKAKEGQRPKSELDPPSWVASLTEDEINQVESNAFCLSYMNRLGYKTGGSTDYSGLKTSLDELGASLTEDEQNTLDKLSQYRAKLSQWDDDKEVSED